MTALGQQALTDVVVLVAAALLMVAAGVRTRKLDWRPRGRRPRRRRPDR